MKKSFLICFFLFLIIVNSSFGYITLKHFVNSKDTVFSISEDYGIPLPVLLDWNPGTTPENCKSGKVLNIPFPNGYIYRVNEEDTLSSVARYFFADMRTISIANSLAYPYNLRVGQEILIPLSSIGKGFNKNSSGLIWPVYGVITSTYGWRIHPVTGKKDSFHSGIDIARNASTIKYDTPYGAPVFAAESGTVIFAGENGGYGNAIDIKGEKNIYRYGHLSRICVFNGQKVQKGDIIGRIGTTGVSTGQHLHFEVRNLANTETYDPLQFLPDINNMYSLVN